MTDRPSISVALCTFNGEAFIRDQLNSIATQSRLPDEVVVSDDHSSDGTVAIINAFCNTVPFPVRLHVNEKNLGSARNYEKAIQACQGDVIFFADQDDVWYPTKIETMAPLLLSGEISDFVFSDADIVNESLLPLGRHLWESVPFSLKMQRRFMRGQAFDVLLHHNVVTGATAAFASRWQSLFLPFPSGWYQDAWIALLLAAVGKVTLVPTPLIKYRQHSRQQLGMPAPAALHRRASMAIRTAGRGHQERLCTLARMVSDVEQRLLTAKDCSLSPGVLSSLSAKKAHLQRRGNLPAARLLRVPMVLRELVNGNYRRYASGLLSAARDLLTDMS